MPGFNHRRQFFTEGRRSALDHAYYMEQALLLAREAARPIDGVPGRIVAGWVESRF